MIDTVRHDIVERYPNDFVLATTADDIERIHKQGKIAALMGIEGGHAIEDSLGLLRDYFDLGIRYMTLTHTNTNNWADSSGDIDKPGVEHHNGLTPFGKQVVREMNRLGMMIDISHTADKTFWDALAVSTAPIIASHSSCRALCNVPRNMTDEMIAALGKKGRRDSDQLQLRVPVGEVGGGREEWCKRARCRARQARTPTIAEYQARKCRLPRWKTWSRTSIMR